jgi:CheY-like chemotaxis protein
MYASATDGLPKPIIPRDFANCVVVCASLLPSEGFRRAFRGDFLTPAHTPMPLPRTILCIDDNALLLRSLRELLENSSYRVLTAGNGHDGLSLLSAHRIDAAVVDFEMPGMNGGDFVHAAKARVPDLRIILFTGAPISLTAGAHALVDRVIAKGTLPNLLEQIEDLLGEREEESA